MAEPERPAASSEQVSPTPAPQEHSAALDGAPPPAGPTYHYDTEHLGELREALHQAIQAGDAEALQLLFDQATPRALASAIYDLSTEQTVALVALLGPGGDEEVAELVSELDPGMAADVLRRLSRPVAADVLEEMAPDDATDIVAEFEHAEAEAILVEMEPAEAEDVRELLAYPPDSAGGLMTPDFVSIPLTLTADEAIATLRGIAEEVEVFYYVYVTDPAGHLLGVLSLHKLVLARPHTPVTEVMVPRERTVTVPIDLDREAVAQLFAEHRLMALPVVDAEDRIRGVITADDVAEAVEEETTEDITRLGAAEPLDEPYLRAPIFMIARKRVGWLLALFLAQAYTGTVLRHFQDVLEQFMALAFFVPLLIGTGGNAGSQTVTTVIRAMAVGEVGFTDLIRVLWKELRTSVLLGAAMALASFGRSALMGVGPEIGLVVGLTALAVVMWAATVASVLPLVLRRFRIDPAVVSAPLISTLVDGTGLFLYFTIAKTLLIPSPGS